MRLAAPCGAAAWLGPGGDWSPVLDVAGGDRIEMRFAQRVDQVEVAATTNHRSGLQTPDGARVRNETLVGPVQAEALTPDGTVHAVVLPRLDVRARTPLAFAIVARAGGQARHFAMAIRTPRFERYGTQCGVWWDEAGDRQEGCPNGGGSKAPPPTRVPVPPPSPPLREPDVARAAGYRRGVVTVRVRVAQPAEVRIRLAGRFSRWVSATTGRWTTVRIRSATRRRSLRIRVTQGRRRASSR